MERSWSTETLLHLDQPPQSHPEDQNILPPLNGVEVVDLTGDSEDESDHGRSRSPSVEFLGERRLRTPTPPPAPEIVRPVQQIVQPAPAAASRVRMPRDYRVIHAKAARASARFDNLTEAVANAAALVMYTDGSLHAGRFGGGAIVYKTGDLWAGKALALGEISDANHAEMSAIYGALMLARQTLQPHQQRLVIVTDSSHCLGWVADGCKQTDYMEPIVTATVKEQERFARNGIKVTFQWVKGHAGTAGNVVADKLAAFASKEASKGVMVNFDIPDIEMHLGMNLPKRDQIRPAPPLRVDGALRRARKLELRRREQVVAADLARLRTRRDARIGQLAGEAPATTGVPA